MRGENARLGVETITRSDLTARSATKPRSSSSIGQWHTARPDWNVLEKRPVAWSKDLEQSNGGRPSQVSWSEKSGQVRHAKALNELRFRPIFRAKSFTSAEKHNCVY